MKKDKNDPEEQGYICSSCGMFLDIELLENKEQEVIMTVTIPACEQHEGFASMTVTISDYCPKCGKKRGVDTIHKGFSYDGSRRLVVDCWTNPCGHIDKYSEVREEVKRNKEIEENDIDNKWKDLRSR